jgi:hypothetical protein
MIWCELEPPPFFDAEADELSRRERAFVRVDREQLYVTAVVECGDHTRIVFEDAVRQWPPPKRDPNRHDPAHQLAE